MSPFSRTVAFEEPGTRKKVKRMKFVNKKLEPAIAHLIKKTVVHKNQILDSRVIPPQAGPTDPVCCPKRKSTTYSSEGHFRKAFTSEVVNGNEVKETLDDDILMVMDVLVCPTCQIRWLISDEATYKLYADYHHLLTQLANGNSSLAEPLIPAGWVN